MICCHQFYTNLWNLIWQSQFKATKLPVKDSIINFKVAIIPKILFLGGNPRNNFKFKQNQNLALNDLMFTLVAKLCNWLSRSWCVSKFRSWWRTPPPNISPTSRYWCTYLRYFGRILQFCENLKRREFCNPTIHSGQNDQLQYLEWPLVPWRHTFNFPGNFFSYQFCKISM